MGKKLAWICCICMGLWMIGCGVTTTPEIIMPDEPVASSVSGQDTQKETPAADRDGQEEAKPTAMSGAAGTLMYRRRLPLWTSPFSFRIPRL